MGECPDFVAGTRIEEIAKQRQVRVHLDERVVGGVVATRERLAGDQLLGTDERIALLVQTRVLETARGDARAGDEAVDLGAL